MQGSRTRTHGSAAKPTDDLRRKRDPADPPAATAQYSVSGVSDAVDVAALPGPRARLSPGSGQFPDTPHHPAARDRKDRTPSFQPHRGLEPIQRQRRPTRQPHESPKQAALPRRLRHHQPPTAQESRCRTMIDPTSSTTMIERKNPNCSSKLDWKKCIQRRLSLSTQMSL